MRFVIQVAIIFSVAMPEEGKFMIFARLVILLINSRGLIVLIEDDASPICYLNSAIKLRGDVFRTYSAPQRFIGDR